MDAQLELQKLVNGQDAEVAPGSLIRVGETVNFDFITTNTGNTTLTLVAIIDDQLGVIDCPQSTLAPGEAMTCSASATATADQHRTGFDGRSGVYYRR